MAGTKTGSKITFKRLINAIVAIAVVGLYLAKGEDETGELPAKSSVAVDAPVSKNPVDAGTASKQTSGSSGDNLRIGTWNLEWLGTPNRRKGVQSQLRSGEDLALIAKTMDEALDWDVAILNEINIKSQNWKTLQKEMQKRGFKSVSPPPRGEQETTIVYRKSKVKSKHAPDFLDIGEIRIGSCRSQGRRPAILTLQAGELDVTVVGVHLRSQRPSKCGGDAFPGQVRAKEAETIVAYLKKGVSKGRFDQDIVILGDFNVESEDASLKAFHGAGRTFVTKSSNLSPKSGRYSHRKSRYKNALDHIVIAEGTQREYVVKSAIYEPYFSQMGREELDRYRAVFSDHAPVTAEFQTHLPDDD